MFSLDILKKTLSLGRALLTGVNVSPERLAKRIEICSTCENVVVNGNPDSGLLSCGLCGCKLSGDNSLVNLARFEETDSYGCKADNGSKWKAQNV